MCGRLFRSLYAYEIGAIMLYAVFNHHRSIARQVAGSKSCFACSVPGDIKFLLPNDPLFRYF